MAVKEGYKQTEVGVIPEDWEVFALADLCEPKGLVRGPFGGALKKEYFVQSGYKVYEQRNAIYKNIQIGNYYVNKSKYIELSRFAVSAGDMIISCSGTIGRIYKIPQKHDQGIINQALLKITLDRYKVVDDYFEQYFNWEEFQKEIIDSTQGGAMKNLVGMDIFKNTPFPIPPLPEQKAIAKALSNIDGLINSLTKLIEKKKNIKQGAMQELLTGKKRLDGFSGEWVFRTMGNLFKFSGGFSASREQLSTEGYSYLHYGDIHGSAKTFVDIKAEYLEIPKLNVELKKISKDKLLQHGDIVFVDASEDDEGVSRHVVIRNTQGIPFISGLHTIVAKGRTNELDNLYKEFCFQSQELKKQFSFYAVGIKVSGISRSNIIKIVLRIPPTIEEQIAIATILSDMDSEIETLQAKLDKYKAIKQGMMQELLTGRIRLLEGA